MYRVYLIVIALCLIGCNSDANRIDNTSSLFEVLDGGVCGVEFTNQLHFDPKLNIIEYLYYYNGGGVAVGDLDNEVLDDIYFTGNQVSDKLYKNLGGLEFQDFSTSSGIDGSLTWSSGVSMVDVNEDRLLDIDVCKVNREDEDVHNLLFIMKEKCGSIRRGRDI